MKKEFSPWSETKIKNFEKDLSFQSSEQQIYPKSSSKSKKKEKRILLDFDDEIEQNDSSLSQPKSLDSEALLPTKVEQMTLAQNEFSFFEKVSSKEFKKSSSTSDDNTFGFDDFGFSYLPKDELSENEADSFWKEDSDFSSNFSLKELIQQDHTKMILPKLDITEPPRPEFQMIHKFDDVNEYVERFNELYSLEFTAAENQCKKAVLGPIKMKVTRSGERFFKMIIRPNEFLPKIYQFPQKVLATSGKKFKLVFVVHRDSNPKKLMITHLNLFKYSDKATSKERLWTITPISSSCSFRRQILALKKFKECQDNELVQIILGNVPPLPTFKKMPIIQQVPNLPMLNESQMEAIAFAIQQRFSIIKGPPGTGKTTAIIGLIHNLIHLDTSTKFLVTAPSNMSVINITNILDKAGFNVVRHCSKFFDKQHQNEYSMMICSDRVKAFESQDPEIELYSELDMKETEGSLSSKEHSQLKRIRARIFNNLFQEHQIVSCTLNTSGSKFLKDLKFDVLIVDEATQAVELDLLIALMHNFKKVILIGDVCQLGPTVLSQRAADNGYACSTVQRLVEIGMPQAMLQVQYRMHEKIAEFPSKTFYDGKLQTGVSIKARTPKNHVYPWPKPGIPLIFIRYDDVDSEERDDDRNPSKSNTQEARIVFHIIETLRQNEVKDSQIGVITPYVAQVTLLKMFLYQRNQGSKKNPILIGSVDSFQGMEKDYIILSCVRSNQEGKVGFLKDPKRLNVSLTRAKFGLFIVGKPECLRRNPLLKKLYLYFESNDLVYTFNDADYKGE